MRSSLTAGSNSDMSKRLSFGVMFLPPPSRGVHEMGEEERVESKSYSVKKKLHQIWWQVLCYMMCFKIIEEFFFSWYWNGRSWTSGYREGWPMAILSDCLSSCVFSCFTNHSIHCFYSILQLHYLKSGYVCPTIFHLHWIHLLEPEFNS